jgi:nucleotide-binding universal stress UspA family protein
MAVGRAALLARHSGATVELLHVVGRLYLDLIRRLVTDQPLAIEQQLVETARAQLEHMAVGLRHEHGISINAHALVGTPHAVIGEQATALGCDLAVLGAHGENMVLDLLPGTTVQEAVRQGTGSALIVKQEPAGAYRRVLVPVDFSDYSRLALDWARPVAPDAQLYVMHAYEVPFEGRMRLVGVSQEAIERYRERARRTAEQELAEFIGPGADAGARMSRMARHGYPAAAILQAARDLEADLIALGASGRSGVSQWLLGSVANHVVTEAGCDVLIAKRAEPGPHTGRAA